MENIASASSIQELEVIMSDKLSTLVKIDNGKLTGLSGYKVERKGNRYVCYQLNQKDVIEELRIERNKLMVSGDNPKRLEELKAKINYFDYGIR